MLAGIFSESEFIDHSLGDNFSQLNFDKMHRFSYCIVPLNNYTVDFVYQTVSTFIFFLKSENSSITACVSNEIPVIPTTDKSVMALFCFVTFVSPAMQGEKMPRRS